MYKQLEDRIHALENSDATPAQAAAQNGFPNSSRPAAAIHSCPAVVQTSLRKDTTGQNLLPPGASSQQHSDICQVADFCGASSTHHRVSWAACYLPYVERNFRQPYIIAWADSSFGGGAARDVTGIAPSRKLIKNYYGDSANPQNNDDNANFGSGDDSSSPEPKFL